MNEVTSLYTLLPIRKLKINRFTFIETILPSKTAYFYQKTTYKWAYMLFQLDVLSVSIISFLVCDISLIFLSVLIKTFQILIWQEIEHSKYTIARIFDVLRFLWSSFKHLIISARYILHELHTVGWVSCRI